MSRNYTNYPQYLGAAVAGQFRLKCRFLTLFITLRAISGLFYAIFFEY